MPRPPVILGETQVKITQGAADADVPDGERGLADPRYLALQGRQGALNGFLLPADPVR